MPIMTTILCQAQGKAVRTAWFGMIAWLMGSAVLPCTAQQLSPMPTTRLPVKTRIVRLAGAPRPNTPTRSLFRFNRDDNTPGHLTRVRINVSHQATTPVNPRIFGNFIEHLGGAVYQSLWAQVLLNPNLEQTESQQRTPPEWEVTGPVVWQAGGYLSPRCVRLLPIVQESEATSEASRADAGGILTQTVYLPAHRTLKYTGHLFLRAPNGQGQVTVALQGVDAKTDRTFAQVTLTAKKDAWTRHVFSLTLPAGALAKGEATRFVIRHSGGTAIDVDQCELLPDDNVQGLDLDVLRRAQALHIPVVRYPGGNFASGYHWQDGIHQQEQRPTRRNPAWGGVEPNSFGTPEFLHLCHLLGAEPQLTVNAGDGTPEEAAAWVQYCNAPATNRYGRLRAEDGSPQPYGVHLWEIGNELYGSWQIGHTDAEGNAARFVRFRDAMLQADPQITLIATGKGEEFTPEGWERDRTWNESLLRAALANGGSAPDYLSLHPLVPLPDGLSRESYAVQYESAMAFPTFFDKQMLPDLARLITDIEGPQAKTRLALTEWGIIVGGPTWRQSPNHDALSGAIFNALMLNTLLRNSDWVTLANMTALLHGGGIKKPQGVVIVDPQYWTQQLYTLSRPHTPVETITTGPGTDVPARAFLPAVSDVPDVDIASALTQDGKTLVVYAVNRHRTEARPLQLEVQGLKVATVSGTLLTGPDLNAGNSIADPDAIAPRPLPVPAWPAASGAPWQIVLPPHALVVLSLRRAE